MESAKPVKRLSLQSGPLRELIEMLILGLIVFLLAREAVQNFQVEGSSMEPTLNSSDLVLVNKVGYWEVSLGPFDALLPGRSNGDFLMGGPSRGSVIIFRPPYQTDVDYVKRVIGLPGDLIEVRAGRAWVNGRRLLEDHYTTQPPNYSWGPARVPPEHYFVLGDNRNRSSDSHNFGPIHEDQIVGEVIFRWFPFNRISDDIRRSLIDIGGIPIP